MIALSLVHERDDHLVIANGRVGGSITGDGCSSRMVFVPGFYKGTKYIPSRTSLTIAALHRYHAGQPTMYNVTAWGKIAEICARFLSAGRSVHVKCQTVDGKHHVREILFDEESRGYIDWEIAVGLRPRKWYDPLSPDYGIFAQYCAMRAQCEPDYKKGMFGYARIADPNTFKLIKKEE